MSTDWLDLDSGHPVLIARMTVTSLARGKLWKRDITLTLLTCWLLLFSRTQVGIQVAISPVNRHLSRGYDLKEDLAQDLKLFFILKQWLSKVHHIKAVLSLNKSRLVASYRLRDHVPFNGARDGRNSLTSLWMDQARGFVHVLSTVHVMFATYTYSPA